MVAWSSIDTSDDITGQTILIDAGIVYRYPREDASAVILLGVLFKSGDDVTFIADVVFWIPGKAGYAINVVSSS